jgi:YVTN family beta-propeller protein
VRRHFAIGTRRLRVGAAAMLAALSAAPVPMASAAETCSMDAPTAPRVPGRAPGASPDRVLVVDNRPTPEPTANVEVISPDTGTIVRRIPVRAAPHHLYPVPGENEAYVSHLSGCGLDVLDLTDDQIIGRIPTGPGPRHLVFSRDGSLAYAADFGGATLTVIDTHANRVVAQIPTGAAPNYAALSGDGRRVFVVNSTGNSVTVADAVEPFAVIATVPVGGNPFDLEVTPDGATLAVTNAGDNTLTLVDVATLAVTGTVPLRLPGQADRNRQGDGLVQKLNVRMASEGRYAWVGDQLGARWSVVDVIERRLAATFDAGGGADILFQLRKGPLGGVALGSARYGDGLAVLDPNHPRLLGTVRTTSGPPSTAPVFDDGPGAPSGTGPHTLVTDPSGTRGYVSDRPGNSVSVLDLSGELPVLLGNIAVGGYPDGLVYVHFVDGIANAE